ncbi:uncharacterized protein EMH_0020260 [Eimeria mitis]|uniref:Uncharacterized protein n=1 Tax=Eimeria mitis TaxID=44415 RepID=U6KDY0_9EIME|nr:uncharacterized protein EMH_0020260 [Eimeria mitis]CDJ34432.1 hypothetical protein, conserved [Eimeria mitis]
MVFSAHARLIPLLWCLFGLFANNSVLFIHARRTHGAVVPISSLTPSADFGQRAAYVSGSFLSTSPRPRSASFNFGSPEEPQTPEESQPLRRSRSLSLGAERKAPSGVWSREGEMQNQLQPEPAQQQQQEVNQEQKRRLGRMARLRRAIRRAGGAAKERLVRAWQRLRRAAARAKRAVRRAAANVYQRLPRFRRGRRASEGAERAAAAGLAGAGLAAAATGLPRGEEATEGAEAVEKEEAPAPEGTPVSTAAEETAAPPSEEAGPTEESEEWHEAPTPEEAEAASEEWHDAVGPEELGSLLARARDSEKMREEEIKQEEQEAREHSMNARCYHVIRRMTPTMKRLNEQWSGHCMFWSLFMRNGNFGTFVDLLQELAVQTGDAIQKAEQLKGTEEGLEAQMLRTTLVLALAEDELARLEDETNVNCWFIDPDNLFRKANEEETKVLRNFNPLTFFANPLDFTQPLSRLINVVYEDTLTCIDSAQAERNARQDLQQVLTSEKQKLEAAAKQTSESLSDQQMRDMLQAIEELDLLRRREYCSMEQVHLLSAQARNIRNFIADYMENGKKWWKAQWPFKLQQCRALQKGSSAVPKSVAKSCRDYESSKPPKNPKSVSATLLWMWEAGSCRKEEEK